MSWVLVVVAILVIGAVCLGLVGKLDADKFGLPDTELDLRPVNTDYPDTFDVVVRGYRMDEVDARIAQLESEITALKSPEQNGS